MHDDKDELDEEIIMAILVDEDQDVVIDISDPQNNVVQLEPGMANRSAQAQYFGADSGEIEEEIDDEVLPNNQPDYDQDKVVSLSSRASERFKPSARSKKQWITIGVLLCFGVITSTLLVLESSFYDVDKITINNKSATPLTKIDTDRIVNFTGSLKSDPMYRLDSSTVKNDLSVIPTLDSVSIEKEWPNKIVVTIEKRTPVAYIETDRGVALVDNKGYIFRLQPLAPKNMPSLDGLDEVTFTNKIPNKAYLDVVANAPKDLHDQISHVSYDKGNFAVELRDGIDIKLGDSTDLKEKLAIAQSVINAKKRSELGYIDVSVPSLPVSGSPQLKV